MRILFVDTPYEFLIEVIIRILFIYILLVLAMRFIEILVKKKIEDKAAP